MKYLPIIAALGLLAGCGSQPLKTEKCPKPSDDAPNVNENRANVWDDGYSTYLNFPGNQQIPNIYALRMDGQERTVNYSQDNATKTVVVHGVYPTLILRDGERMACITNNKFDQVGVRRNGS